MYYLLVLLFFLHQKSSSSGLTMLLMLSGPSGFSSPSHYQTTTHPHPVHPLLLDALPLELMVYINPFEIGSSSGLHDLPEL